MHDCRRAGSLEGGAAVPAQKVILAALAAPLVERLRQVKDEDELALMSEAALLGCKLFEHVLGLIRPGMAEMEVAAELEHRARLLGAEGMSFDTIVASGVRSALPHGRAPAHRYPRGDSLPWTSVLFSEVTART